MSEMKIRPDFEHLFKVTQSPGKCFLESINYSESLQVLWVMEQKLAG